MKILLIDNYDSFTFNLYQYLQEISDHTVEVVRNDMVSVEDAGSYDILIFSPGPGIPKNAGKMPAIIDAYKKSIPMLGVCLGHQAIGESYGAKLINLDTVYHGVDTSLKLLETTGIFNTIKDGTRVGRYHSWSILRDSEPGELVVTARDENGEIMAIRHKSDPVFGVQFHPESILTPDGKTILKNFLNEAVNILQNASK